MKEIETVRTADGAEIEMEFAEGHEPQAYIVLWGEGRGDLEEKVREHIAVGYQLQGGVSTLVYGRRVEYVQAMMHPAAMRVLAPKADAVAPLPAIQSLVDPSGTASPGAQGVQS